MALPTTPGVYIMKDKNKKIIYIGKAKALKNRVSSYFGSHTNHTLKVIRMVEHADDFDYILCDSEFEALVLECSLIKQHQPKYNILLKDDKGYNYIKITPPPFSKISECKQMTEDGSSSLGPYTWNLKRLPSCGTGSRPFVIWTNGKKSCPSMCRRRMCLLW